ncbi:uncharacterized protein LOC144106499 [Amblyomma americanum]
MRCPLSRKPHLECMQNHKEKSANHLPCAAYCAKLGERLISKTSFEQNRADGWKKLKPNAVPTVLPFRELAKERRPPRDRSAHVPALFSDDTAAQGSSPEVRNVLSLNTQVYLPADSSSDGVINEKVVGTASSSSSEQLTLTTTDVRPQETAVVCATRPFDCKVAELRKKIADLTAANNKLKEHYKESKNSVKKLPEEESQAAETGS